MPSGDVRAGRRPAASRPRSRTSSPQRPAAVPPVVERDRPTAARPVRRAHLTGRAAVLLVVVAALAVTLAWPARALVEQRREVGALRAENAATQERVAELQRQVQRWDDPAYVEAQARARLHFVRPGETAYVVLGAQAPAPQVAPRTAERTQTPWYAALWESVQGAGADAG